MMNINRPTKRAMWRLLVPVLAVAVLGACGELTDLDESAETFISPDQFYRNDAQAMQAVNGVYAPLMGWNGWKSPAQYGLMCDDDELQCWNWMSGGFRGQQAGQWYMQDNSVYIGDYQIIERANQVLKNVPASGGISAGMKDVAMGQALFARGYAYFDLVRRYGGVPLRLDPYTPDAVFGAKARTTPDSIWLQAAKDLRAAAQLLPATYATPNGKGLPAKAAAWGLLAKVYLHMAGAEVIGTPLEPLKSVYVDSSRLAALEVMNDATVGLEPAYMDLFDHQKQNTSREILFAVQGASVNNSGSQVPGYFGPRGDCTVIGGCGQGFLSLREDFYDEFNPQDKRIESNKAVAMSWEITNSPLGKLTALHVDSIDRLKAAGVVVGEPKQFRWESWTEGCGGYGHWYDSLTTRDLTTGATTTRVIAAARPYYTLKYIDRQHLTTDQAAANNFIILRHADVLLTFAEAENEKSGPTTAAYNAINAVRARAEVPPLSGLSQAQFRQAVWQERQFELYAEFQRRFDMVRQGTYLAEMNKTSAVGDFTNHGVCKPRLEYQKLQNIPNRELAANPLMTQNPGY